MAVGKTVFGLWWQEAILDYNTQSRKPTTKELAKWLHITEAELKSRFWEEYNQDTDLFRPVGLHCDELRIIVHRMQRKYPYFCITNSSILDHERKKIRRSFAPLWGAHIHLPRNTSPIIHKRGGPRKRYDHSKPRIGSLRDVPVPTDSHSGDDRMEGDSYESD